MPKQATFYVLKELPKANGDSFFSAFSKLIAHFIAQNMRIYIHAENQAQAYALDEFLWQLPPANFLAHHLIEERTNTMSPIEIGYNLHQSDINQSLAINQAFNHHQKLNHNQQPSRNRQLLINLATNEPNFATRFNWLIDFVPCEEKAKQFARERYKIYRQAGFSVQTLTL